MKKRSIKKRLLALFCVVSLVFGVQSALPVMAEQSNTTWDENLKMITFSKFRIPNGTYGVNTEIGLGFQGEYEGSLDGTLFSGNICFSDKPDVMLIYGAPGPTPNESWTGIGIESNGDGTLVLRNRFTGVAIAVLNKDTAKMKQLTEAFLNLKISIQYIDMDNDNDQDKDDVKLGVWFNDQLYNNQYFEVENLALQLGSVISCYVSREDCSLKIESADLNEKKETINPSWEAITLKNFGISNGTYKATEEGVSKNGFEANGGYPFSLNNTIFSANVEFSSVRGVTVCYGGGPSPWHGLRFDVLGDRIRLCDATYNAEEGDKIYYFDSLIAGVSLLDNKFNLKLSTEYVDSDGDGAKDDVKFGVWFNDVLYNNEYIYFKDYALEMGGNFTVFSFADTPESYLFIESDSSVVTKVDFSLYGFTTNWDKELGAEL